MDAVYVLVRRVENAQKETVNLYTGTLITVNMDNIIDTMQRAPHPENTQLMYTAKILRLNNSFRYFAEVDFFWRTPDHPEPYLNTPLPPMTIFEDYEQKDVGKMLLEDLVRYDAQTRRRMIELFGYGDILKNLRLHQRNPTHRATVSAICTSVSIRPLRKPGS